MRSWRPIACLLVLILAGVIVAGCSTAMSPSAPATVGPPPAAAPSAAATLAPTAVRIRVANTGNLGLAQVKVRFPSEDVTYGDVATGAVTAYRQVKSAYRYAWIRALVGGGLRQLRPIDYVGEQLLPPGDYTYEIYAVREHKALGGLNLKLHKDR